ncbi:MAG: ATP-dependent zinc metalloprotease FtsH [Bacteroidetes bacterium]|nr:ATP-dependent zinc metalloprotease FtsH [Bacteroidota bacterium]
MAFDFFNKDKDSKDQAPGQDPSKDPNKNPNGGNGFKPKFSIWMFLILLVGVIAVQAMFISPSKGKEIPYSEFRKAVAEGKVKTVFIGSAYLEGVYKPEFLPAPATQDNSNKWFGSSNDDRSRFLVVALEDKELIAFLETNKVDYRGRIESTWVSDLLGWIIPFGLIALVWVFIFKRMSPGSQVMNIGKNKAVMYAEGDESRITFKDVAGLDEAKEEVREIVEFLKDPSKFTRLGGKLPKGVLLVGPPGTGKTLIAKAMAGEAGVPFFSLSGSDFVEMFVGVGAARVRDLFKQAKDKAPCIIFIDEMDAIGRSRGRGAMMGTNDERENTLNQLLVEMDGFSTDKGVIIVAATNRPDVLDPALLRPGRFDRQVLIDKPDLIGRIAIFRVHTKNLKLSENVDLRRLASQTPGFAGADIANICNEAALLGARKGRETIDMDDFYMAIERSIAGLEKKNKLINPKEKKVIAYHESGHAIIGWFLENCDPVSKVSIVPRGFGALGYTLHTPLEDRYLMTRQEILDRICGLLGGRVAEEIVFGDISTGAQNDLERVTDFAYAMVTVYGMSEKIGYLSFADSKNQNFVAGMGFDKKYGSNVAMEIDSEVRKIITECHDRTRALLNDKRDLLNKMAETLLEKEILDRADLEIMLGARVGGHEEEADIIARQDQAFADADARDAYQAPVPVETPVPAETTAPEPGAEVPETTEPKP